MDDEEVLDLHCISCVMNLINFHLIHRDINLFWLWTRLRIIVLAV